MAAKRTSRSPKKGARERAAATRRRDWAPTFLEAFERTAMVTAAAEAAGIARRTAYDCRERDPDFAQAWDEIVERTTERMEAEAYRRAVEGVEKPVFQGGEEVGRIREFSDTLTIFLLKARRPAVYRERVEHSGPGGRPVEHRMRLDLSQLTDEQLQALRAIRPADDDDHR